MGTKLNIEWSYKSFLRIFLLSKFSCFVISSCQMKGHTTYLGRLYVDRKKFIKWHRNGDLKLGITIKWKPPAPVISCFPIPTYPTEAFHFLPPLCRYYLSYAKGHIAFHGFSFLLHDSSCLHPRENFVTRISNTNTFPSLSKINL